MATPPSKPKSAAERTADAAERTARATERTAKAAERTAAAAEKTAAAAALPAASETGDAQHLVIDLASLTPEERAKLEQFRKDFKKRILHVASAVRFTPDK